MAHIPAVLLESKDVSVTKYQAKEERQLLGEAETEWNGGYDLVESLNACLRLAEKRWQDLKTKGAAEPSFEMALASLRVEVGRLAEISQRDPAGAYELVDTAGHGLQAEIDASMHLFDALEETMTDSEQCIEHVKQAILEVRSVCNELRCEHLPVDLDESLVSLGRAVETCSTAESHHATGTMEGYETAITLSQAAIRDLAKAEEAAELLLERTRATCGLLAILSDEGLADWRRRANRVRQQLEEYTLYQDEDLVAEAERALSFLRQAESDLAGISVRVRLRQRFRRSELDGALRVLSHAQEFSEKAKKTICKLESEVQRARNTDSQVTGHGQGGLTDPHLGPEQENMEIASRLHNPVNGMLDERQRPQAVEDAAATDIGVTLGETVGGQTGEMLTRVRSGETTPCRMDGADVTATSHEAARNPSDPPYRQGMAHFQAGEWEEAVRCLEQAAGACPDSDVIRATLENARLRARLDTTMRVRARRRIIPWRRVIAYLVVVPILGAIAAVGGRAIHDQILPGLVEARIESERAERLSRADAFLGGGDLDAAEALLREILAQVPTHEEALQGMEEIAAQHELLDLYRQAVAAQEVGDYEVAKAKFAEMLTHSPGYRDVQQRMAEVERRQGIERLFAEAEADHAAERYAEVLDKCQELQTLDVNYRTEWIADRRFEVYMALGRELVEGDTATSEVVPRALDYFSQARALKPRNGEAALEQRLARLFIQGETEYREEYWDEATVRLSAVCDQRLGYLGGMVVEMLYDAYIRSGDEHREAGDRQIASEQYRKAAALPVEDTTLALRRLGITPTQVPPTPTPTPMPTPTPTVVEGDGTLRVLLAPDAQRPVPPNIEIVLDASASMWGRIEGKAKINIARQVLGHLFDELPNHVNVALRASGHQYHFNEAVCTDTELLVPLVPLDRARLVAQIDSLNPRGVTLIGYTVAQLKSDLADTTGQSVVVLISDGKETCDADPCKVAKELVASGLDIQIHVIGYAVDDPDIADQLACIAEVTGGSYLPVGRAEQLLAALREAVTSNMRSMTTTGSRQRGGQWVESRSQFRPERIGWRC